MDIKRKKKEKRIQLLGGLIGICVAVVSLFYFFHAEKAEAEKRMVEIVNYVKVQCSTYTHYNESSESKSLLRAIESARQMSTNIDMEVKNRKQLDRKFLKENLQSLWVDGILVLDEEGKKVAEHDAALCAKGCEKASEFIQFCDAFDIPVLSLTNVAGFTATKCSERRLAKALAKLTYAFANATVPKVSLLTGNAYGSAAVMMNSKAIGADLVYAWPDVKTGMMDARLAAEIMYADADADKLAEKAKEYEALQSNVVTAAKRGYVDLIIEPADTRKYLVAAFEMLFTKRMDTPYKKHGTK